MDNDFIKDRFKESMIVKNSIIEDDTLIFKIDLLSKEIVTTLKNGSKIFLCGNGTSAIVTQNIESQMNGIFYYDRPPLNVESLNNNTSYLTAISNLYSFDEVYARLVLSKCNRGDMLIAFSTSGNSNNIINALNMANNLGVKTIGFTGADPGMMLECCGEIISVPSNNKPRINEEHMFIGNLLCEIVESIIYKK